MSCQMKTVFIHRRSSLQLMLSCVVCCFVNGLAGCAASPNNSGSGGSGGGAPAPPSISGNWQLQATQTAGPATFTSLAGFINQQGDSSTESNFTTAALQSFVTLASTCYSSATAIPLEGSVQGTQIGLRSFSVNGQFLSINATEDATGTHMTGTYVIDGGCADGAKGTITGTEYALLTGVYSGMVAGSSPAQTLVLTLSQTAQGAGDGIFFVTGSAVFSGFSCFTKGTLTSPNGFIIGNSTSLTFTTNDINGASVVLTGTIDPAADTLTLSSVAVVGGTCQGTFGVATLTQSGS